MIRMRRSRRNCSYSSESLLSFVDRQPMEKAWIPYLLLAFLAAVIVLRIAKAKRSGLPALKVELFSLIVYAFFLGTFFLFLLMQLGDSWIPLLLIGTLSAGFFFRAYPVFRMLDAYDPEKRDRSS